MLLLLHVSLWPELVVSTGAGTDGRIVECAPLSAYVRSTCAHGTLYVPEALRYTAVRCRWPRTNQCVSRS